MKRIEKGRQRVNQRRNIEKRAYLATILPRAVEVAPTTRSHDCERVGGSSFKLRGKRVAGAKRRGDKKGCSSKEKKKK